MNRRVESSIKKTAAEIIAKRLYDAGCRFAFGIPGGEVLALINAMHHAGIVNQLVKHENCAGFMAEGVWHATGAPAVLFATIGPGIANATNTIANAWQDRVPMIVLTGCVSPDDSPTYTHQVLDHVALLQPISKAVFRVQQGTAAALIDKALCIALSGRPGPVALDVPISVQQGVEKIQAIAAHQRPMPMIPDAGGLSKAHRWLANAKSPLMIAGVDALNQNASQAINSVCRVNNIPLITTYKAKGIIPEDHPLAISAAGLSPLCDAELLKLVKQADCIVLAGYDPIEMRTGWRSPFSENQKVIEISADINTHSMHQADINFIGDVGSTLSALFSSLALADVWLNDEPERVKSRLKNKLRGDEDWGPAAVVDEVRGCTPKNTVATVDSGAHRILLSQLWQCYEPKGLLQSSGLCTMGCAVPLAIGRKIAEPQRPVIAFVGDAGLEMFLGELATIRDLAICLPIIVFVDAQLGLIELKQRNSGLLNQVVNFNTTDFDAVAVALGGYGVSVNNRQILRRAVTEAFTRDSFTLISAHIGMNAYDGRL